MKKANKELAEYINSLDITASEKAKLFELILNLVKAI